ncbi:MAG: elongation factor G, partial [Planctomycetes bacterium]|nr:elongation factor G [Planctomycetota bacterium]
MAASEGLRNVVLIGHEGAGKTTLVEALLVHGKVILRMGSVRDGTTVCDFDPEEKEQQKSFCLATVHLDHKGSLINLVDTPGAPDFIGETLPALRAVECALLCIDATGGIKVNARVLWKAATEIGLPRFLVVTRLDGENVDFARTLAEIQETFGKGCVPFTVPDVSGPSIGKVETLLDGGPGRESLVETIVESDDRLMERYLEGGEISGDELRAALGKAVVGGTIFPVFSVASEKGVGIAELLDGIVALAPKPDDIPREAVQGDARAKIDPSGGFIGYVFKTIGDDFVTRISQVRVLSGKLSVGGTFHNRRSGRTEKVGTLWRLLGKESKTVSEAGAGDIVAVTKIEDIRVGDTLTDAQTDARLDPIAFPTPMVSLAVMPKSRGDEQKLSGGLRELAGDDATFLVNQDAQTGDLVISGMSDLHLNVLLRRLRRRRKVEVTTKPPKIPYRETVTKAVKYVEYTHKKQTGGAGQYARVFIDLEPTERGDGYEFVDKIVGGVIDTSFRPSVDKGIQAKMAEGVLAGYPVVDVRVSLVDGKTHPVDSKDIAFQIAGREAFKKAFMDAKPVILEPIVKMEITVPQGNMGDIMGDLNQRRGRIVNTASEGNFVTISASVPLAEIQTYQADLKSITGGQGTYLIELDRYEVVPSHVQEQIIAKAKADRED